MANTSDRTLGVELEHVEYAKQLVESWGSQGKICAALVERFGIRRSAAHKVLKAACLELYDDPSTDFGYWLAQTTYQANPQQRRFAKQKIRAITSQHADPL